MQIHNLKRKTKNKRSVQVGRGGTRGKTSGKGTKGQNARAGRKKRPEMRDIIKRLPKLRGRGVNSNKSIQDKALAVNVSELNTLSVGAIVSPTTLVAAGIIEKQSGKFPRVKILGTGDLSLKLTIRGCEISASAKEKVLAAGGSVE